MTFPLGEGASLQVVRDSHSAIDLPRYATLRRAKLRLRALGIQVISFWKRAA